MGSKLDRKVFAYAAAAAAAGTVGAASTDAAIVYTPGSTTQQSANQTVMLDGTANSGYTINVDTKNTLLYYSQPTGSNAQSVFGGTYADPSDLAAGTTIGPASTYQGPGNSMDIIADDSATNPGNFPQNSSQGYLGVRFTNAAGLTEYGWIGLQVASNQSFAVTGYAYDNTGASIAAGQTTATSVPEPASLSVLALGAAGLLKRKRTA